MRKRIFRYAMGVFVALGLGGVAQPQTVAQQNGPVIKMRGGMGPGSFAFERIVGGFGGKVVTGAPFSAQVTRSSSQTLSDGTKISRNETGSIARDSVGRTRQEMSFPAIGPLSASGQVPHIVFIRDNAAGKGYVLNENRKTVMTMPLRANGKSEMHENMRMNMKDRGAANEQKESLGTKTMDGLTVEGTRFTRTIAAGKVGNDKPIVITTEEWYSPQLQMVVSRTHADPRFGTMTYQLSNVDLNEPPQSMFVVPEDYTPSQGRMRMWRKGKNAPNGAQPPASQNQN
ncbi:MAG TPA: hypothetical protein VN745_02360 [Verrucomicrobiae bacterium]|nr:hypothetical protein [Verrucomicrobiae bacterium]